MQPGSIKDYSLGRGSLANKERLQVGGVRLIVMLHGGCAIAMKRDNSHITYPHAHPDITLNCSDCGNPSRAASWDTWRRLPPITP